MTARFFVAGFVETDGLPSSLSADLFLCALVTLMEFSGGSLWKFGSSSSSPLVKGVPNVELVLLLKKGIEETLVDVVETSAAASALYLAMVPTIKTRLMFSGQEEQWFIRKSMERRTKMSDVGRTETKFQFQLFLVKRDCDWKNARPLFGKYRVTPQARRLSVLYKGRPSGEAGKRAMTRMGTRHELTAEAERN